MLIFSERLEAISKIGFRAFSSIFHSDKALSEANSSATSWQGKQRSMNEKDDENSTIGIFEMASSRWRTSFLFRMM
jgi:uncharacterized cupin superfamily protein